MDTEVVSLNSEPVFDEGDEFETEGDGNMVENDGGTLLKSEPEHPTVGLEFDSFDEAYDFYNVYAKGQGFGIRVSNSWFRSKRKERYRAKLSCSSAGFKKKTEATNPRPDTRTGCPAMVVIRLVDSKRWRMVELELQHNHPLSPQVKRFYKSHKKMILAAQKAEKKDPLTEIHIIKLYQTSTMDANLNQYVNADEGQIKNTLDQSKHLELNEGDAHAVYNFFCRMKLTNPNFFYLMDLDNEGRLRNMFWADARSRAAYEYFCDTVSIDTTSLSSKYEIPLISFVGVNNHGQSVLLGCGFLGHESTEYFVWMFRTWLTCMRGQPPSVIITDLSKHLQFAVAEVFPAACHCYCLSYIMQRLPERLGGLKGYDEIKKQLNKVVYDSLKITEFETSWNYIIKQHGLGDHRWLLTLYENRKQWVPVYLKDTFLAGMIPDHENQFVTGFFDGYIHKHTSFKEFVDKYDLALHRRHLKEAVSDLESTSANFELKTKCSFELQLSKLYTKEIFERFQVEVEGMYSCFNTRQVNANGPIMTYIVKERVGEGSDKEVRCYEVLYEATQAEIRCICSLFNFKGYLCRHALNVLNFNGIEEIPSRYILPRWDKDFKRTLVLDRSSHDLDADNPTARNYLYRRALQVVEEGALSQQRYRVALQELEELLNKFSLLEDN